MLGSTWRARLKIIVAIVALKVSFAAKCLADEALATSSVDFSGYVDGILPYDRNDLLGRARPYTTQPYYSDEPALNLGYVDARLRSEEYRGRLALQWRVQ